jgi:thiosulfate/3-mercaptopyruvate sulfurtransferase
MTLNLPALISPAQLAEQLGNDALLIVDVSAADEFSAAHIPGAVQIEYAAFVTGTPPVMGLITDSKQLSIVLSAIGLTADKHVVAYDRQGGGQAGRLLYTLEALGHHAVSLLDGGLQAWANADLPLANGPAQPTASNYQAEFVGNNVADKTHILSRLGSPDLALLDCRSPAEFNGSDMRAMRGGHIPGAVNFNWTDAFDPANTPAVGDLDALRARFKDLGVTPDKEIVLYCHTHTRSSHTYMLLKHMGYSNLKGYPGAWSDWGNDPDTPVEQ